MDGSPLPPLFNFTPEELRVSRQVPLSYLHVNALMSGNVQGVPDDLRAILVPPHARNASNWGPSAGVCLRGTQHFVELVPAVQEW
jgi:hypothetical protein